MVVVDPIRCLRWKGEGEREKGRESCRPLGFRDGLAGKRGWRGKGVGVAGEGWFAVRGRILLGCVLPVSRAPQRRGVGGVVYHSAAHIQPGPPGANCPLSLGPLD